MSNFSAFNKQHLQLLLEPFAPGITDHITPIHYEAITPDCFMLLFRTTAQDGTNHFFVSLETDFINTLDGARCTIEDWHGNDVLDIWPLNGTPNDDLEEVKNFQTTTSGPYIAMLAEVKRPTKKGFWSDAITIIPGDNIAEKICTCSIKAQENIRKALAKVLQHKTDPTSPFLDAMKAKQKDTIVGDVNKTQMAVTFYVQPDESVELFYNYVKQQETLEPEK